jgi:ferrochelatase
MPFLENVTRGRGIPRERLVSVAEHYHHFGGRSPINDQNRALLAALRSELDHRGLPATALYWGNRNWNPLLTDTLRQAHMDGVRRLAVVATSAYASYSGCRQYREDLARALTSLAAEGRTMAVDKIRHYYNPPGFVAPVVDATLAGLAQLPEAARAAARVVFVTHSVPLAMNETSGPEGHTYVAQHEDVARTVAGLVGDRLRADRRAAGRPDGAGSSAAPGWDLVYCSRSGPPSQPWLEPDVNDHLRSLAAEGLPGAVVVPVGFVSDHMEVVYDLDTEARATAAEIGLPFVRAATVGTDPRFVTALVDLVLERAAVERGEHPDRPVLGACSASYDVCPVGCCPNLRAARTPAACGADWDARLLAPSPR